MKHSTRAKLLKIFDGKTPVTGADRAWALSMVGSSQAQIAEALGISGPPVNQVIHDRIASYNIASKIAEVTGLSLNRLWPCGKYAVPPAERKRAAMEKAA